jgi:hypothetical protein
MSGPGTPSFLEHAKPYRMIKLRQRDYTPCDPDDPADTEYVRDVGARPCPEGWVGWHYREHMATQLQTIWSTAVWEEVGD